MSRIEFQTDKVLDKFYAQAINTTDKHLPARNKTGPQSTQSQADTPANIVEII